MKKLLLTLGALSAVVAPVAAVVACGTTTTESNNNEGAAATTKAPAAKAPAAKAAPATTQAPQAIVKTVTVDELINADAAKLAAGLTAEGTTLTHFMVVTAKTANGFSVRSCFVNSRDGKLNDHTNTLFTDGTTPGKYDYSLAPGFDASKIKVGDVLTEELNTEDVVTTTTTSYGKSFPYGLVSGSEVSFLA